MNDTIKSRINSLQVNKRIIIVNDLIETPIGAYIVLANDLNIELLHEMREISLNEPTLVVTEAIGKKIGIFVEITGEKCNTISLKDSNKSFSNVDYVATVKRILTAESSAVEFQHPGHIKIKVANPAGSIQTEDGMNAAVDLAILNGAIPCAVVSEVIGHDGLFMKPSALEKIAEQKQIEILNLSELISYRKRYENHITREVETVLPSSFGQFKIIGYSNTLDDKEHLAIVKGDVAGKHSVITRIHSECLTGDIFGSYRCDCGPQLHAALNYLETSGEGVVVYMRQEGRGIGLINKLKAYELQDKGYDTYEANVKLGFLPDAREYYIAAEIIQDLGIHDVQLLTNNPDKISALEHSGVMVQSRIPLQPDYRKENAAYLETKFHKFGHLLEIHK